MIFVFLSMHFACMQDYNGTVVGNPGSQSAAQVAPSTEVEYTSGRLYIESISYLNEMDCPSEYSPSGDYCPDDFLVPVVEIVEQEINLLDPSDKFVLRNGEWTSVTLTLTEKPILIEGVGAAGNFQLSLDLEDLTLTSSDPYSLQGDFVLELGRPDWLQGQDLSDVEALTQLVRSTSVWVKDFNGDGLVQDSERQSAVFVSE